MDTESLPQQMRSLRLTRDGRDFDDNKSVTNIVKEQKVQLEERENFETLVEVRYVSVQSADIATLQYQRKDTTPGFDVAGVVVKDNSGKWQQGDRVCGLAYGGLGSTLKDDSLRKRKERDGTFATYVNCNSAFLFRIPDKESFERAAAVPYAYMTAFQAFDFQNWPANQSDKHEPILICGGSTMTGLAAIQIAHRLGHRVLTTSTHEHADLCKQFGADKVYNYKDADVDARIREDSQNNLQFAIDAVCQGNSTTTAYKAMGSKGGRIITVMPRDQGDYGTRSDIRIEMKLPTSLWGHPAEWQGIEFRPSQNEHNNAKAFMKSLGENLKDGKYRYLPTKMEKNHGLDGVLEALEQVRKRHPSGYRLVACVKEH